MVIFLAAFAILYYAYRKRKKRKERQGRVKRALELTIERTKLKENMNKTKADLQAMEKQQDTLASEAQKLKECGIDV